MDMGKDSELLEVPSHISGYLYEHFFFLINSIVYIYKFKTASIWEIKKLATIYFSKIIFTLLERERERGER